jgi:uncharacterized protein YfkK (UPF0435 family)
MIFSVRNTDTLESCVQEIQRKLNYGRICVPIVDFEIDSLKEQVEIINASREI